VNAIPLPSRSIHLHQIAEGRGTPIVFAHEFAGDAESWRPQLDHFARSHRCIAFNARGYPPSAVSLSPGEYSQDIAADDIAAVVTANRGAPAHLVGLSMGAMAVLHCALRHPDLARSIVLCGCGPGASAAEFERWRGGLAGLRRDHETMDRRGFAEQYSRGPTRRRLVEKDPAAHARFVEKLAQQSAAGPRLTLQHTIAPRARLSDLRERIGSIACPALIIVGDEDELCLDTALFLKRTIPEARLVVVPCTGHAVNQEEPDAFNAAVAAFFASIEA
jgi:pimeloyl-ACP methyl ester carboxylesterase